MINPESSSQQPFFELECAIKTGVRKHGVTLTWLLLNAWLSANTHRFLHQRRSYEREKEQRVSVADALARVQDALRLLPNGRPEAIDAGRYQGVEHGNGHGSAAQQQTARPEEGARDEDGPAD